MRSRAIEAGERHFAAARSFAVAVVVAIVGSLVLLAGAPATAQAPAASPNPIDELVITGTAFPRPPALVSSAITILDGNTLRARGLTDVVEALRTVPGLAISQPGGAGTRAEISIRGSDPNHTLVLLDGVRQNDPTNARGGAAELQALDLAGVERIEIVRGPQSARYGPDALGGVVHVITKRGSDPGSRVAINGGRYGDVAASAEHRRTGFFDSATSASVRDTGADLPSDGRLRQLGLRQTLGRAIGDATHVEASARVSGAWSEAFPDASGGVERAVLRVREEREWLDGSTGLVLQHTPDERVDLRAHFESFHRREERESPGVDGTLFTAVPAEDSSNRYDRVAASLSADASLPAGFRIAGGADVAWEQGETDSTLFLPPAFGGPRSQDFALDRLYGGPYVEGQWESPVGLVLLGSLRVEYNDDTHAQWLPRGGFVYETSLPRGFGGSMLPGTTLRLRGNIGRGYKLASFFALGNPIVGDASLTAEESFGWDLGFDASFHDGRVRLELGYFQLEIDDLIDFDPATFSLVNRERVVSRGVEAGLAWTPVQTVTLAGHLTWNDVEVRGSDRRLENRPEWRGDLQARWQLHPRLELRATHIAVGEVASSANPTGTITLDAWHRLDLAARIRVGDAGVVRLLVAIDNATDTTYREAVGFPAPGVRPRLGLELDW